MRFHVTIWTIIICLHLNDRLNIINSTRDLSELFVLQVSSADGWNNFSVQRAKTCILLTRICETVGVLPFYVRKTIQWWQGVQCREALLRQSTDESICKVIRAGMHEVADLQRRSWTFDLQRSQGQGPNDTKYKLANRTKHVELKSTWTLSNTAYKCGTVFLKISYYLKMYDVGLLGLLN